MLSNWVAYNIYTGTECFITNDQSIKSRWVGFFFCKSTGKPIKHTLELQNNCKVVYHDRQRCHIRVELQYFSFVASVHGLNEVFIDIVNDHKLELFVNSLTRMY